MVRRLEGMFVHLAGPLPESPWFLWGVRPNVGMFIVFQNLHVNKDWRRVLYLYRREAPNCTQRQWHRTQREILDVCERLHIARPYCKP